MQVKKDFDGAPWIYLHKDDASKNAEYYMRSVQLATGSPLYVVTCEVATLRTHKTKVTHDTDQWAQPGASVKLVALWALYP